MGQATRIEWTDRTWNPVRGCSRVSEGCRNCYAERQAARFADGPYLGFVTTVNGHAAWTGKVEPIESRLTEPLAWRKPARVFVNSMSDLFHEKLEPKAIARVYAVMGLSRAWASGHVYQVLTKRSQRRKELFASERFTDQVEQEMDAICGERGWCSPNMPDWPFQNVWEGVSVEDQPTADTRVVDLLQTSAWKRFVSYEPALAGVNWTKRPTDTEGIHRNWLTGEFYDVPFSGVNGNPDFVATVKVENRLDWVIVGGESGPWARPFDVDWARSAVEACKAAGVAVFVKQLGADPRMDPADSYVRLKQRLRLVDKKGGDMAEWPEDLRVREFPV